MLMRRLANWLIESAVWVRSAKGGKLVALSGESLHGNNASTQWSNGVFSLALRVGARVGSDHLFQNVEIAEYLEELCVDLNL